MAIEIVDFPINSMVMFHCYVSSPEGIYIYTLYYMDDGNYVIMININDQANYWSLMDDEFGDFIVIINANELMLGGAITSLKNMSLSMGRMTSCIYEMENKNCLKPPTRIYIWMYVYI